MQINSCLIKIYISANPESFQILIPLPMVFWPPTRGILTPYPWYIEPHAHAILTPRPMV